MLIGLKVSSMACKYIFYRPEHNAKGGPHGTEFWRSWNAKMKYTNEYRAQRVDEKKWSLLSSLEKTLRCIWKILFSSFRKWYGLFDIELPWATIFRCLCWLSSCFYIFTLNNIPRTISLKPINRTIFRKSLIRSCRCT